MAEDVVRVLLDKRLGDGDILQNVFAGWVRDALRVCSSYLAVEVEIVEGRLQVLLNLVRGAQRAELLYQGRELLEHIEVIVSSTVLMYDATVNPHPIAQEIAVRWVHSKAPHAQKAAVRRGMADRVKVDKSVFLGEQGRIGDSKL